MTKTSFEWLLSECTSVETIPNINNWNIRNVVSLANAFISATNFNSDISEWDTSNVITFENMFFAASNFNQNISANVIHKNGTSYVAWNTKNVVSFENTFQDAISFNNGETEDNNDIDHPLSWDTTSATIFEKMFYGTSSFNQSMYRSEVTLTTSLDTNFSYTFTSWDMEMATNAVSMFQNSTSFNGDIGSWNVRNTLDFSNMFNGCTNFEQYIGKWHVLPGVNLTAMFSGTKLRQKYPYLLDTPTNVAYFFNLSDNSSSWTKLINGEPTGFLIDIGNVTYNMTVGDVIATITTEGTDNGLVYTVEESTWYYTEVVNGILTIYSTGEPVPPDFSVGFAVYDAGGNSNSDTVSSTSTPERIIANVLVMPNGTNTTTTSVNISEGPPINTNIGTIDLTVTENGELLDSIIMNEYTVSFDDTTNYPDSQYFTLTKDQNNNGIVTLSANIEFDYENTQHDPEYRISIQGSGNGATAKSQVITIYIDCLLYTSDAADE